VNWGFIPGSDVDFLFSSAQTYLFADLTVLANWYQALFPGE